MRSRVRRPDLARRPLADTRGSPQVCVAASGRRIVRMYQLDTSAGPSEEDAMSRRTAVLALLHQSPMHGYELGKRLNSVLGSFRAFSYGSLYPCLKDLLVRGWIAEEPPPGGARLSSGRSKIVYRLTADGKERFQDLLA